ncbi:MAG: amidohydrolase family protein, partial [Dongiaceae bacterium]
MASHLTADLLLRNGKIASLDQQDRFATAVAVWNGRIIAVGSDASVESLRGPGTRTIDLHGRTVVPGIIDSHCHADMHAIVLRRWHDIGWPTVKSIDELLSLVAAKTAALPDGEILLAFGYNDQKCGGYPTRDQLDLVSRGRPVWLYRTDHHIAILNTAALRRFGIAEETADPPHGRFDRDPATGRMTGLLREMAAWTLEARLKDAY